MIADDIKLPPLPRLRVPLIEADVDLLDIKVLARWCERTATDYARAAVLADRASREPSPQGDAQPTSATLRCRRCGDTAYVSFSYASAALAQEDRND